ncbi:hypothetical protein PpBr36_03629 [Pyricularia pennisetigena]|uniref:hypothetical protein n=1 Tax=Pyricularia pennisetigena TaxID=1578925 RepID=UPI001151E1AB|nr:hypothetical protein PpBr36_03629 [Pyricularia pennisetigena]TLS31340.1 hypothetical protein PpBr36_03629 [Pyricularia pennisetigena]
MDGTSSPGGASPPNVDEDVDLYELLEIDRSASASDIKKAYHKAARQHHPDKVPEERKEEAEATFKAIQQAYEILRDDEKRHLYDTHGMAAFDPSRGPAGHGGMGMDDLQELFASMGMGMGGMGGMGGGRAPKRPQRGADQEIPHEVTLEDLYRGKTVKFASSKRELCSVCKGSGARDKYKPQDCDKCQASGFRKVLKQVAPGLVSQDIVECDHCQGTGKYVKEKERCKKCKGRATLPVTKALEIYIPRGAFHGEKVVLEGEADQLPGQTPGDIIIVLVEKSHDTFTRIGHDLSAELNVTLAEALMGFSRVVLKHLDGRGLHLELPRGKVLRPSEILKVPGEGMPHKRGDARGDLYLIVKIEFPEDGWLKDASDYEALQKLLPPPPAPITADEVDEVEYERNADIEQMGASAGETGGSEWEDEEEAGPQCATQ